jgi:hypothetical protein
MLQAQVAPHFLVNTLAKVQAVVDAGSPQASADDERGSSIGVRVRAHSSSVVIDQHDVGCKRLCCAVEDPSVVW